MNNKSTVAISADFLTAYAALPRQKQGKVTEFFNKFRNDPMHPGINFEKINEGIDKNICSVRIDDTYRGIVVREPKSNVYILLWVDHHDEAYAWAKRKKCSINKLTGSVQIFDVQEVIEEQNTIDEPALFANISDLFIDTSETSKSSAFNYFNRSLFSNLYSNDTKLKAKNAFREKLSTSFEDVNLPDIDDRRRFGIDNKKVVLESVVSVYEDSIPLENKGSGMESLVKTQIALNREDNLDTILIEEPENHLCFTNLKQMLQQIMDHEEDSQIILTTHSNMIASRLNLRNVIWIAENHYLSLKNVEPQTSIFFEKADDNEFLQLLLSKKAILVEGATEYLLLPKFYEKKTGRTVENDGISIISCNGISYKRYLEIAEETGKRIAVITDNDHEQTKIDDANEFNQHNEKQHVFMGATMEDWTWEACIYNCNKEKLHNMIQVQDGAEYLFHRTNYGQVLGKMLNNKVDTAYQMLISEEDFVIPRYVEEAIEWLNE